MERGGNARGPVAMETSQHSDAAENRQRAETRFNRPKARSSTLRQRAETRFNGPKLIRARCVSVLKRVFTGPKLIQARCVMDGQQRRCGCGCKRKATIHKARKTGLFCDKEGCKRGGYELFFLQGPIDGQWQGQEHMEVRSTF